MGPGRPEEARRMAERITSKTNSTLQHIRRLLTSRKYRYECRSFVADGVKLVDEALHWSIRVEALVLCDGVEFPVPEGVREIRVPPALMKDVSRMETPQGVIALCRMPEPEPFTPTPGCLILDGIQDPGNLGTILRTADAFEIPVVLADGCADPYGEKTVRASMGAVFRSPPRQIDTQTLIRRCAEQRVPICATALSPRAKDIRTMDLWNCAVVIGSEGKGVCAELLDAADREAIIPMNERCESLNAAVAAALVMWQIRNGGLS